MSELKRKSAPGDRECAFGSGQRRAGIRLVGEGVCSDSSSVDNKALAVNVLLPGTLQGHNLLQMPEADVQLEVTEGGESAMERQKKKRE